MKLSGPEVRVVRESDADMDVMIRFMAMVKKVFPDSTLQEITPISRTDFKEISVEHIQRAAQALVPSIKSTTKIKKAPPPRHQPALTIGAVER